MNSPRTNFDISEALLAEVDFKWLMSGQGWPVDMVRFQDDPSYATRMLETAISAGSPALRECAASLLKQMERTDGSDDRNQARGG